MNERDIIICGHGSNTPSLKNMWEYLEQRYQSRMTNGVRKGVLKVRRLKGMDKLREDRFRVLYKTILGRNSYSQDLRQYVYTPRNGRYYSDCSSSGCATYQRCGFEISLLNTAAMLGSDLFEDVPVRIRNGHIENPEELRVGDAILFAGNIKRPSLAYVGHVEYVYQLPSIMRTGWQKQDGAWYYYVDDIAIKNAWRYIDSRWYVFAGDGRMIADEWFRDSTGLWYYLGEDGGMLSGQWLAKAGHHYYLCKDGHMAVNCYVRDTRALSPGVYRYYWVNELGEWCPDWDTDSPDLEHYSVADSENT